MELNSVEKLRISQNYSEFLLHSKNVELHVFNNASNERIHL